MDSLLLRRMGGVCLVGHWRPFHGHWGTVWCWGWTMILLSKRTLIFPTIRAWWNSHMWHVEMGERGWTGVGRLGGWGGVGWRVNHLHFSERFIQNSWKNSWIALLSSLNVFKKITEEAVHHNLINKKQRNML